MAGVPSDEVISEAGPSTVADVPTHVSPMSRLMTMASPAGAGDAFTTTIPIEGRDEWLEAAERWA